MEFQLASMNEQQSAAYQRIAELAAESQWLTAELTRRNSAEANESAGVCATEENPSTLPEVLTDSNTLEASQSFIFEKNSAEYSDSTAGRTAGDIVKKVDIKQRLAKSKRAEFRRLLTVEESSEVTELRARCLSLEAQILKTMEDCRHKCEETAALSADKEAQWMQYIASQKEAADQDYGFLVTQYEVLERRYAGTNSQRPPNDRNFDELHMNYQWQHRGVPSIQGGNVVNDERSAVLKLDAGTAFERLSHGVNQREAWEGYPGERHDTHNELLVSSLVDYQTCKRCFCEDQSCETVKLVHDRRKLAQLCFHQSPSAENMCIAMIEKSLCFPSKTISDSILPPHAHLNKKKFGVRAKFGHCFRKNSQNYLQGRQKIVVNRVAYFPVFALIARANGFHALRQQFMHTTF